MSRLDTCQELQRRLNRVPPLFRDDGCSRAPDRLFGASLTPACRVHDFWYCTRVWPAGTLTQAHRHKADEFLGLSVRALLPFGVGWIGWLYWRAVHWWGGTAAFDSCGLEAGTFCRHGIKAPWWMLG